MNTENLIDRFGDAGLTLELAGAPFNRNADIFQMDIRRRDRRAAHSEYFLLWPGHRDNLAVVQGLDAGARQLVLMVREPEREFFVPRRVGRETIMVRRTTPGNKRHFLVGRDERQLFMCRLPRGCTTVREAHDELRAPEVKDSRSAIDRTLRQGEWFFLVPGDEELAQLESALRSYRSTARRKVSIGSVIPRAGKPHVADELVVHLTEAGESRVYVRGAVRHADHKTIWLEHWRQVVRNREVTEAPSLFGGTWID
jgi:hypothetical protein